MPLPIVLGAISEIGLASTVALAVLSAYVGIKAYKFLHRGL